MKGAEAEEKELEDFAELKLEPWDRAYVAERLREAKYNYSEEELKRCFELETALAGLFRISKVLFGIDVVEVTGEEKPSVWHEDVRFFRVKESGSVIAEFYFDPFVRVNLKSGGAWMNEFMNYSARRAEKPLALVVMNLPERDSDGKCFMPFREVETLFHEFGHALQCMLTRVAEEDAAGINLVEWDAVEVASQFMENWCLDELTEIEIPSELKVKVRAAKNFRAASFCRRPQIIYLLGIGKFYAYDYAENSNRSSSATSSLAFSTLSGQLNNMLSQAMENKNWNIGANLSTGQEGWSDVEAEAMLSGRLLNNRLLINGNFGYRENVMANTNFVGDFEAVWLLTKNGEFRLRGYNQTNDRYFTKSTLTTQGIGFIYKKDFDKWTDLFQWLMRKQNQKKEK